MASALHPITDRLIASIPDDEPWLTPDDLQKAGFPEFLVARIRVEVEQNLAESVRLPDSDWADMHAHAVQDAWAAFLDAIRAETRVPVSYLRPVLETSLEDILEQLTAPRTAIPDHLFGSMTTLDAETLAARASRMRIYPHLSQALVRHMERRGLETLTKTEAAALIASVDEVVTRSFTALNWGQTLSPLFDLSPDGVDPAWVAAYFRNRGMKAEAAAFDAVDAPLTKGDLIETLSRPHFEVEQEVEEVVETVEVVGEVETVESDDQGGDVPIWQRFAPEPESKPEPEPEPEPESESEPIDADERPIIDLYASDTVSDAGKRLSDLMEDVRDEVTAALFGGDDIAYDAALAEIARFPTYAEAGRYIKRDIIDRNRVDLYSDEAVLFLDRIQTYFLDNT